MDSLFFLNQDALTQRVYPFEQLLSIQDVTTVREVNAQTIAAMKLLATMQGHHPAIVAGESGAAGLAGFLSCANDSRRRALLNLTRQSEVLLIGTEGATDPELYACLMTASESST